MKCSWSIVSILISSLLYLSSNAYAEILNLNIIDQTGNSVKNVVVSAYLLIQNGSPPAKSQETVIIDQIDKKFIRPVTPIQVGTAINFPNYDQIRHHVYSLSPAKKFEIPLYKGTPAAPVVFNQKGVVVLGCNIHDTMSAYIVVIDSPYFAITNEQGQAELKLATGEYELQFWHRDVSEQSKKVKQLINITAEVVKDISIDLVITPSWTSSRLPFSRYNRGRYR